MSHISDSLAFIKRHCDSVIVAVSGGKDSLVTLDLCCRAGIPVAAFFMYLVPDLDVEEKHLRAAERRHRLKIHRVPSPMLNLMLRKGELCPPQDLPVVKPVDVENQVRRLTGMRWIASGMRKQDSLQRRGMLNQCGCCWEKFGRLYPIGEWSHRNVFDYLRSRKIPIPVMLNAKVNGTSGVNPVDPQCLTYLREHHPGDFRKLLQAFPYAESVLFRDEVRANHGWTHKAEKRGGERSEGDHWQDVAEEVSRET